MSSGESETPALVPPQMQKYLRAYVLSRAFNRQGQGYQPTLAAFLPAQATPLPFRDLLLSLARTASIEQREAA